MGLGSTWCELPLDPFQWRPRCGQAPGDRWGNLRWKDTESHGFGWFLPSKIGASNKKVFPWIPWVIMEYQFQWELVNRCRGPNMFKTYTDYKIKSANVFTVKNKSISISISHYKSVDLFVYTYIHIGRERGRKRWASLQLQFHLTTHFLNIRCSTRKVCQSPGASSDCGNRS